jgi:hypothetical protein
VKEDERVAMGAEFLDEHFGSREAWASKIDVSILDLTSTTDCVLGQVFGHYREACEELEIGDATARALGLNFEARSNKSWLYLYGVGDAAEDRRLEREEANELRDVWVALLAREEG